MRLLPRSVLFIVLLTTGCGALILALAGRSVQRAIVTETASGAAALAAEVTPRMAAGVQARSERALLPLLRQVRERVGAEYAMVLDPRGVVLAHTNVLEVHRTLDDAAARAALAREGPGWTESLHRGAPVLDVTVPIPDPAEEFLLASGAAQRIGVLRLGVPAGRAHATVRRITRGILWILAAAALVATAAATLFTRRMLAPIRLLEAAAEGIAAGKHGVTVPARRRDELGSLADGFNRMSRALEAADAERRTLQERLEQAGKLEALGLLAGKVSHDFNTILGVIRLSAGMLRRSLAAGDPNAETVDDLLTATERGAGITRQLQAFSRGQFLQLRVLDVNAFLEEHESLLRTVAGERAALVCSPGPRSGRVRADPAHLAQVLMNLVGNARDAVAPPDGRIEVATAGEELDESFARLHPSVRPGPYVRISVGDNGAGMDEETLARVFEPFFTTKGRGQGTGLGLATVYGIVRQSGGYVYAESGPGRGTVFHVYLPAVDAPVEEAAPAGAPHLPRGAGETLLLVEDDPVMRRALRSALTGAGYAVLEASGGREAFRAAEAHAGRIHLLLTDVVMPLVSGYEVARRLTAMRPDLKVIYMSGYAHLPVGEAPVRGQAFLEKPFGNEELLRRIREVLDVG